MIRSNSTPRRADGRAAFAAVFGSRRLRGMISPGTVDALASAIQTHEGYYPGSVAWANNNPGNLRFAGQSGASPGSGGFARFASYDQGLAALKNQITLDATRGTDAAGNPISNISELISSWAPSSENDTAGYIAAVASATGFDPSAPLSSLGSGSSSAGFDLSALSAGVDLSGYGLPSTVPVWGIAAAALAAVLIFR